MAINTKEDLDFFLWQIDLANDLISKNLKQNISETLKEKIPEELFLTLVEIEKDKKEREKKVFEEKRKEIFNDEEKTKRMLNLILKKEKKLEKKLTETEKEEEKAEGTEKEKETEEKRWALEEERIKIEKEKWELKEKLKKLKEDLEKLNLEKREDEKKEIFFFLRTIRDHLLSLPQISVEVAFNLPEKTILKIINWFEENLKKKFILNFKVNPKIIGGAILEYKGKIFNLSLLKEIRKEIERLKHGDFIKI